MVRGAGEEKGLARCLDGATGHRREYLAAILWIAGSNEPTPLCHAVVHHCGQRYPLLCGAELLINRFRTECYQLEEPDWLATGDFGSDCPGLAGMPHGLGIQQTDGVCFRCGARPFWPVHECDCFRFEREYGRERWPHICHSRAADHGCIYAICNQRGVCIYPEADGSRCSLIRRGEP